MKKVLFTVLAILCIVSVTSAQKKMAISIQGGIAMPMGDFSDAEYKMGFGGTGTFIYNVNDNLGITASAGYFTWSNDIFENTSFSDIPILGGVRFAFGKGNFKPYILGEIGMHLLSFSYEIPSYSYGGVTYGGGDESDSESKFGFGFGGGFMLPLGKMNLDVTAKYVIVSGDYIDLNYLQIVGGVAFPL
ncbi:MAG: outer membrane beta-barrel protein [bacterium]